jgi:hypothetical protein
LTASLTVVPRRLSTILVPAVAIMAMSSLTAGCSTVEENASARVNDIELTPDELTDLVDVLGRGEVSNGDAVRGTIQTWVLVEVAGAQFEMDGTQLTDDELAAANAVLTDSLPGFADLSESTQETLVQAQATLATVNSLEDGAAFIQLATSNADIYVDPRLGQFDPTFGVVPLAIPPATLDTAPAG